MLLFPDADRNREMVAVLRRMFAIGKAARAKLKDGQGRIRPKGRRG